MTHYPATRFAVRPPAPSYRPASRWPTFWLFASIMLLILLGAAVEGRAQATATVEHPYYFQVGRTLDPAQVLSITAPENLIIAAGTGLIKISFKTGKVEVVGVTLDEASRQFWVSVAKEFPECREAMLGKCPKYDQTPDRLLLSVCHDAIIANRTLLEMLRKLEVFSHTPPDLEFKEEVSRRIVFWEQLRIEAQQRITAPKEPKP